MSIVIDIGYLLAVVLGTPWIVYVLLRNGKYRKGLRGRLGGVERRKGNAKCLWVHGVSVGEVLAAKSLIEGFENRHTEWEVVVSTTTSTGQEVAKKAYPNNRVIYYPVDFGLAVRRTMRAMRPSAVVLVEADLWPNFLGEARRSKIPVVMVNNRITERAFGRQLQAQYLSRTFLYDAILKVTAQTDTHAQRLRALGLGDEQVVVTGSVKYDSAPTGVEGVAELRQELGLAPAERVIVAGSTFAPEEKILLGIYARLRQKFPGLRLVISPRHPQRFDEVARGIEASGFALVRRSKGKCEGVNAAVILGDTMGELVRMYGLADVVFVGKTLVEGGGQNIIEPAALGKAVVFGPSIYNFQEPAERLLAARGAVQVKDADELERALEGLLAEPEKARETGARARQAVDLGRGATERNLAVIDKVLAENGLL